MSYPTSAFNPNLALVGAHAAGEADGSAPYRGSRSLNPYTNQLQGRAHSPSGSLEAASFRLHSSVYHSQTVTHSNESGMQFASKWMTQSTSPFGQHTTFSAMQGHSDASGGRIPHLVFHSSGGARIAVMGIAIPRSPSTLRGLSESRPSSLPPIPPSSVQIEDVSDEPYGTDAARSPLALTLRAPDDASSGSDSDSDAGSKSLSKVDEESNHPSIPGGPAASPTLASMPQRTAPVQAHPVVHTPDEDTAAAPGPVRAKTTTEPSAQTKVEQSCFQKILSIICCWPCLFCDLICSIFALICCWKDPAENA